MDKEPQNNTYNWYKQLQKPKWAPPSRVFGPVWSVLYLLIAASYGYTGYLFIKGNVSFAVILPFILNLIFNFSFTPIQFGLKKNFLVMIDIFLVDITLIWALIAIYPIVHWVTFINLPYLAWGLFATALQITVTYKNRKTVK